MSRKSSAAPANQPTPRPAPAAGGSLRWARWAWAAACGVALYLSYVSFAGGGVAGCGAEGGCSEVLNSRWSKWLGIPVSLPAAGLYLALIGLSFPAGRRSAVSGLGSPAVWLRIGAWTVLGSAAWFLFLSAFVLGKFCPYCLTVHLLGSTGAVLALRGLAGGPESVRKSSGTPAGWAIAAPWALLPLGLLIAGQVAFAPKTFKVTSVPAGNAAPVANPPAVSPAPAPAVPSVTPPTPPVAATPVPSAPSTPPLTSTATPTPTTAASQSALPAHARFLALHGGKFQLDVDQLPILGSPAAAKVMVSQFDYTCEHCRRSHGPITQARQYFSNELAVISLPMPLDGRCNEWIRRASAHNNGCQLAALALGVWRADRTKFQEFDHWMMTAPEALKVPVALARARSLVGESALDQAIADPWVANTLQVSIALYRENWLAIKNSSMPMLVVGTNIISGTVSSTSDLYRLLDESMGLKHTP